MKAGDKVVLKGGGPIMTVIEVFNKNFTQIEMACCGWFIEDGNYREETFPVLALKVGREGGGE